jgi:hypothetical protein
VAIATVNCNDATLKALQKISSTRFENANALKPFKSASRCHLIEMLKAAVLSKALLLSK